VWQKELRFDCTPTNVECVPNFSEE
jgi:hypothetical protein